jgi:CRP-like cAMP-binding protein
MISHQSLRHYPFFGSLDDAQLRAIAIVAEELLLESGTTLFREGQSADALYILEEGSIDLYYTPSGSDSLNHEGILVGGVSPGDAFSISSLIDPHILTSTARVSKPSRIIKINTLELLDLFKTDLRMAYVLTHQAAKTAVERLLTTRFQLASVLVKEGA